MRLPIISPDPIFGLHYELWSESSYWDGWLSATLGGDIRENDGDEFRLGHDVATRDKPTISDVVHAINLGIIKVAAICKESMQERRTEIKWQTARDAGETMLSYPEYRAKERE